MLVVWPLQIVLLPGVAATVGIAFTVIVLVTTEPTQPFAVGVIEYWTVPPADELKVSVIVEPVPDPFPETIPEATEEVHEKLVPPTLLVNVIPVGEPLHTLVGPPGVAAGIGLIVTL
jgi:hypothetical protein